ncbi:hypothetical protein ACHAWF_000598 [Thalassiosira exigua]
MATNGPFADDFWKACETELETLTEDMDAWDLVDRTPDTKVLPSTWAFKVKRHPDGAVKKFKACFCVQGDRQQHGISYWKNWLPDINWSAIRTVMILAAKKRLASVQWDITAVAFVTAHIPPDEVVYVVQPRGFVQGTNEVLRLKSCSYRM